jgi:hypothetical protein
LNVRVDRSSARGYRVDCKGLDTYEMSMLERFGVLNSRSGRLCGEFERGCQSEWVEDASKSISLVVTAEEEGEYGAELR